MKSYKLACLLLLLVAFTFAQDLVLTSDNTVQISSEDGPTAVQASAVRSAVLAGSDSSTAENADYGEPVQPAPEAKPSLLIRGGISNIVADVNSEAESSLKSARWITAKKGVKVTFTTPCFHNSCPKGKYTLYFKATCFFTIYLVNQNGAIVQTIGSGNAWTSYAFSFNVPCGRHSLRIVLNCLCPSCAFIKYNLLQNKKGCFDCPDGIRHNYNPLTCQCECANTCPCNKPQVFYKYPICSCGCEKSLLCSKPDTYFNKRTCSCDCLPRCCPKFQTWNGAACKCEWSFVAQPNLEIAASDLAIETQNP